MLRIYNTFHNKTKFHRKFMGIGARGIIFARTCLIREGAYTIDDISVGGKILLEYHRKRL